MKHLRRLTLRVRALFGGAAADAEMERELSTHLTLLEDEMVRSGVSSAEARRLARLRFGGVEQTRMLHREERGLPLLESLIADLRFGWRQLKKRKVTSAAAILSLALAMGSCLAAFRLIDALYLRPLPVNDPSHLYVTHFERKTGPGQPGSWNWVSYPMFQQMREEARDQASVAVVGYTNHNDISYGGYQQMEQAYQQAVSGELFGVLGLKPAFGRLIGPEDDRAPKQSPVAVLSYDYWQRRFNGDPQAIGKRFRKGDDEFEIVGVAQKGYTGMELGLMADIFTPTMMERYATDPNDFDLTLFARPRPGVTLSTVQNALDAGYQHFEQERAKTLKDVPGDLLAVYPNAHVALRLVGSGESGLKASYESPMWALITVIALVLLIACANVANLMSAQSAARAREMAVRVSLGAGRRRLIRMVLMESAMLGIAAAAVGLMFAWWAAPFVAGRLTPPDFPIRLALPMDGTVAGFGLALMIAVMLLFGMLPALRASRVEPNRALKGDDHNAAHRGTMHALIAAQVAFCFVVLFVAGLFTATFAHKTRQPLGFAPEHLLVMETASQQPTPPARWQAALDAVRAVPGVQHAALTDHTMMGWNSQNMPVTVDGVTRKELNAYFLKLSPGWLDTMRIPLLAGRDIRESDLGENAALVNQTFVKTYFGGKDPVGRSFTPLKEKTPITIVGVVGDAVYRGFGGKMLAQVYQPLRAGDGKGGLKQLQFETIMVQTQASNPMDLAEMLRKAVAQADSSLRVSKVQSQMQVVEGKTVQERMLASLGSFFGGIALLLAAIGLYGVLHYSVVQREREIGVRIALGAAAGNIARIVTTRVMAMVLLGASVGLAAGLSSVRFISSLLYQVKGTDLSMMTIPAAVLMSSAVLAALPVVWRAVRINPVVMLRSE